MVLELRIFYTVVTHEKYISEIYNLIGCSFPAKSPDLCWNEFRPKFYHELLHKKVTETWAEWCQKGIIS